MQPRFCYWTVCYNNNFIEHRLTVESIEPTSALDPESSAAVENLLVSELRSAEATLKAIVWITHSDEQGHRVGTRHLYLADGCCKEISQPLV
jgi:ABC-type iron transport system FetAB ATPase subunit